MELGYRHCIIKSFKHNGHLHRTWQQNWLVPDELLAAEHRAESMVVLINRQTPIQEAGGKIWISRVPAVSFFIPGQWFNVVALLEEGGVRYYCNVASPPYLQGEVLTYIDYDLDVILTADGNRFVVDQDEYEMHKAAYHYPRVVEDKVKSGLEALQQRMDMGQAPFDNAQVLRYYEEWSRHNEEVTE
jgi:protein associated with RNAse G/E